MRLLNNLNQVRSNSKDWKRYVWSSVIELSGFFSQQHCLPIYMSVVILLAGDIHFTSRWYTFARWHHFTKRTGLVPYSSLTTPLYIEVPAPSHESNRSCVFVRCIDFVSVFTFFSIRFLDLLRQCGIFLFFLCFFFRLLIYKVTLKYQHVLQHP